MDNSASEYTVVGCLAVESIPVEWSRRTTPPIPSSSPSEVLPHSTQRRTAAALTDLPVATRAPHRWRHFLFQRLLQRQKRRQVGKQHWPENIVIGDVERFRKVFLTFLIFYNNNVNGLTVRNKRICYVVLYVSMSLLVSCIVCYVALFFICSSQKCAENYSK